ncbi:hypothetical protein CDAR_599891 [Caerostris darwini]|uniref:Uncharacterized protein n=1 Tax=Caerostris darwini TaxID=1538125 RepID=A0AAV4RAL6_9ARAC|nr:hypothetical protein CDAR_599891 [Caerostris darwini]
MAAIKFIIVIGFLFFVDNAEAGDGLIKTLMKGIENTADNVVNAAENTVGHGLLGNVVNGVGNIAKAVVDGTEKIVSDADDHIGDIGKAAEAGVMALLRLHDGTMYDMGVALRDTGMAVNDVLKDTNTMAGNLGQALMGMR